MYDIKKNLKVSGKVQFKRQVIVQILSEVLQSTEDLVLERAVAVDVNGNAIELDSIICYVHQVKSDEIPDKYDPAKTVIIKKGFSRPNYGINRHLRDLFSVDKVYTLDELFTELHKDFPHLTKKQLKEYLKRPAMTGGKLVIEKGEYWNPKSEKQ